MSTPDIRVEELSKDDDGWQFQVEVLEGVSRTVHEVGLSKADFEKLAQGKADAARLVKASFEFLLEREDKESIMNRFDVPVITHYFPEFPKKIGDYLK